MKSTFESFVKRAHDVHHNKFKYLDDAYKGISQKITIICPVHGLFLQRGSDHLNGCGCNKCGIIVKTSKNRMSQDEFIQNANIIHNNRYDYTNVNYVNSITKVSIICKEHGIFEQDPAMHLHGTGCPVCAYIQRKESLTEDFSEFVQKVSNVHANVYKYLKIYYVGKIRYADIMCNKHGTFTQNTSNHIQGSICPKCANNGSSNLETQICTLLDSWGVIYEHRKKLSDKKQTKEVDLYIPSKKIAFEINGRYWHSELAGKDRSYHINKTLFCEQLGIRLVHIMEEEFKNIELLKSKLQNILRSDLNKRIYARQCEVRLVNDLNVKSTFLNDNHSQGNDNSQICCGLYYNNEIVSMMTFAKMRRCFGYRNQNGWELVRFCSLKYYSVLGAAGKLLTFFERNFSPNNMITYADRRWSCGDLYQKLGFRFSHFSRPSYWYFHNQSNIYHRYKFAKHTLNKQLPIFDPLLSEWENMKNNGYNRFWDCGNYVFEKHYS